MQKQFTISFALALALTFPAYAGAADLAVPSAFATIQSAIDVAVAGDTVSVAEGTYNEEIDFLGKAIHVRGVGPLTVIRGTGTTSVVSFRSGEGNDSILDSVTVIGGGGSRGGGIGIESSSPTVVRNVITRNGSSFLGSGVYVGGLGATPLLYNNIVMYNHQLNSADPHGFQVVSEASPRIVNNTIVRNDSNGILTQPGTDDTVIVNNIIALNGSRMEGALRGRGICDFTASGALIQSNIFRRNRIAALLRFGTNFGKLRGYQRANPEDTRIFGNYDGAAKFVKRPRKQPERTEIAHLELRQRRSSRALDVGLDVLECDDTDGSRNDLGHTGGPFAAPSTAIPQAGSCGAGL